MEPKLFQHLFQGQSGRAPKAVRDALQVPKPRRPDHQSRKRRLGAQPKYMKAINNGNYYRIKIPPKPKPVIDAKARQLLTHGNSHPPLPGNAPPTIAAKILQLLEFEQASNNARYGRRFFKWLRVNFPVLCLNFGSVCILVGFSRSDILELRTLTMTGQLTFAMYNLGQASILWPSVLWSGVFASVNAYKILGTIHERTAEVHMTEQQETIFVDYFMSHGITPLQYTWIEEKAKTLKILKGDTLIQEGDNADRIFLVVKGSTHAHFLGTRLAAASTNPQTKGDQLEGGDSGAWIGEMAFLDLFYTKNENGGGVGTSRQRNEKSKLGRGMAMYTIIADADCTVMAWSHEDMAELMETSTDLRAALTRATTAAVVGKVMNLSLGDTRGRSWPKWLSNWRSNDGIQVQVEGQMA